MAHDKTVLICKRNITIAQTVPSKAQGRNATKPGLGKGSIAAKVDLTKPAMDSCEWNMLEVSFEGLFLLY